MKYWQANKHKLSTKVPDLWNVGRFIHSSFSTRKEARIMAKRIGEANQYWIYRVILVAPSSGRMGVQYIQGFLALL
jgi:hypothetical protein